ncbi:HNH endonuclease [Escherichia coli]|uniref:HNH endonuclease n=1 Tax=Escherichia coli TaxID=562 RepID=UPI0018820058|nr:HNH endonuclease [Escherichia coli]MBE8981153.1 HNH endonuclease [Escherichia coli]
MTRLEKFHYVINHWYLQDGIVYSKRTGEQIAFSMHDDGHLHMPVRFEGKRPSIFYHEAVYMLHHNRPIIEGNVIHHIDGNKLNNTPENLVELTPTQHHRIHAYQCDDPLRGIRFVDTAWQFGWYDDEGHKHRKHFHEINDAMLFRAEIEEPRRAELRALGLNC